MINIGLKCVALKKAFRVKTPASKKVNNLNPHKSKQSFRHEKLKACVGCKLEFLVAKQL